MKSVTVRFILFSIGRIPLGELVGN